MLIINKDKFTEIENGSVADAAYQFLMEIYARFQKYSMKPDADPRKDRLSMRTRILCLADKEFDALMKDMIVCGHSEGAMIATLLSEKENTTGLLLLGARSFSCSRRKCK